MKLRFPLSYAFIFLLILLVTFLLLSIFFSNRNVSFDRDSDQFDSEQNQISPELISPELHQNLEKTSQNLFEIEQNQIQFKQGSIYLETFERPDGTLEVKVFGKAINVPVLGLAFDLIFDPEILSFEKYEAGSFFEQGGDPIYLVSPVKSGGEGTLVAGVSLRRGDELPQGSGHFLSFYFAVKESGRSELAFQNVALTSLDVQKKTLSDVMWLNSNVDVKSSSFISRFSTGSIRSTDSMLKTYSTLKTDIFNLVLNTYFFIFIVLLTMVGITFVTVFYAKRYKK